MTYTIHACQAEVLFDEIRASLEAVAPFAIEPTYDCTIQIEGDDGSLPSLCFCNDPIRGDRGIIMLYRFDDKADADVTRWGVSRIVAEFLSAAEQDPLV